MQISLKDWGNSKGLRLPKKLLEAIDWQGEDFNVKVVNDRLVAEKIPLEEFGYDPTNMTQFSIGKVNGKPFYIDMSDPYATNIIISGTEKISESIEQQIKGKNVSHTVVKLNVDDDNFIEEMKKLQNIQDDRFSKYRDIGVKNILDYNKKESRSFQRVFVFVDLGLMKEELSKEQKDSLQILLCSGRSAGIHIILTQRNVRKITPSIISANCPIRISTGLLIDSMVLSTINGEFILGY